MAHYIYIYISTLCNKWNSLTRQHNLEKLSFICDAQNKVEIKNKYESINKTDYSAMKEKRKTPTLQISLFFW